MINNVCREEVKERPVLHVLRDQPELDPGSGVLVVGRDEPEDVFVSVEKAKNKPSKNEVEELELQSKMSDL